MASDPRELPQPDLIVLGVKAYDLEETMAQLEPVLKPDTTILTLQNGVTIEDTLMARFGRERIVGGVAFIYSRIVEPGVIDHYKKGNDNDWGTDGNGISSTASHCGRCGRRQEFPVSSPKISGEPSGRRCVGIACLIR